MMTTTSSSTMAMPTMIVKIRMLTILKMVRRLQQIELKGNPIHEFDPDAFVQLPALRKLQ